MTRDSHLAIMVVLEQMPMADILQGSITYLYLEGHSRNKLVIVKVSP